MTIEEQLRDIRSKAALLAYLASSATTNPEVPPADALAGLGLVCDDIAALAHGIARTLPAKDLAVNVATTALGCSGRGGAD